MLEYKKPWELGEELKKENKSAIPPLCIGDFILVKLAPPKKSNSIRDGLVSTLLMRSFKEIETGKETELITISEGPSGQVISFPHGKKDLIATKFRGPKNWYRYINPETNKAYEIPKVKYTVDYAVDYLTEKIPDFTTLTEIEQNALIDEYLYDMFTTNGLALDFAFPAEESKLVDFRVGVQTQFYRQYAPPKGDSKWPDITATKWLRGQPSLSGDYKLIPEELALSIYTEYLNRGTEDTKFEPGSFDEDEDVI